MNTAEEIAVWPQRTAARPFQQELYLDFVRTYDHLAAGIGKLCKQHGLSAFQYNVLRILRGAGPHGLPSLAIAERMINRVPDITRLVDRLEAAGHVERVRSPQDRRVVLVRLTEKALALLNHMDEPLVALHLAQFRNLDELEQVQLRALLCAVRGVLPDELP